MADKGDPCEADEDKLATAHSQMSQLPPHLSKTFHAVKTFFFLAASLPKVKKHQPFSGSLYTVVRSEADGSDLCEGDGS